MKRILTFAFGLAAMSIATACSAPNDLVSRNDASDVRLITSGLASAKNEIKFNAYITGYTYWDNTPRGSTAIARPVIHRGAGGTGTYKDPVTIAVGHKIVGSRQTLDYPAGTRFYLPALRKYVIVEDVCGDGHQPQNGPCHSGYKGNPWLDVYLDGRKAGQQAATQCAYRITGVQQIIMNPQAGYPVAEGAVTESGCPSFKI